MLNPSGNIMKVIFSGEKTVQSLFTKQEFQEISLKPRLS